MRNDGDAGPAFLMAGACRGRERGFLPFIPVRPGGLETAIGCSNLPCRAACMFQQLSNGSLEIYVPVFDIRADQFHAQTLSDVYSLETMTQPPLDRRMEETYPSAFLR